MRAYGGTVLSDEIIRLCPGGLVCVQAFFDDSGKITDSEYVCMAGLLSDQTRWLKLIDEWQNLLIEHKMAYWHTTDFLAKQRIYEGRDWTRDQQYEIIQQFISVIRRHAMRGFIVAVDATYQRSMSPEKRKRIGQPFLTCFAQSLRLLVRVLRVPHIAEDQAVQLVFENTPLFAMKTFKFYWALRNRSPEVARRFPALSHADPTYFSGLQAADFVAFAANREVRKGAGAWDEESWFRDLLIPTAGSAEGYVYEQVLFDGAALESLYQGLLQRNQHANQFGF